MTIAEEIDKKSGRKHRSGTITEAMKYAFGIEHMPTSIADAVKKADFTYDPTEETTNDEPTEPNTGSEGE